ncbi:MAG: PP2C family protein-serine/threonine phosphatase [bacterium]|nr:PP2C family protein-serine/threonine phosphatase [bacterium]
MIGSKDSQIKDLKLNALLEITQAINNNLSEDSLYKIYRFTLLADLKIEKIGLFVLDDSWVCKVNYGTSRKMEGESLPESYQNLKQAEEIASCDELFCEFDEVFPVSHKDKLLAVVFLGGVSDVSEQTVDRTFLQALTNIIIVAIENKKLARKQIEQEAYRKELEIAKQVQNYLIPNSLPNNSDLQLEASYIPHQDVGGDYYDYIPLADNKFMVCIADVSGKGVPAALLMSNFQASLRTMVRNSSDLNEIVDELNYQINFSGNGENFITFFIAIYDGNAQTLHYVNCGHNPPILVVDGNYQLLEAGTTILGMFNPLPFLEVGKLELDQNFLLFSYTDGVIETFNDEGEEFGEDRLAEIVATKGHQEPAQIHAEIFNQVDKFRGENNYRDDITMLSCKVNLSK